MMIAAKYPGSAVAQQKWSADMKVQVQEVKEESSTWANVLAMRTSSNSRMPQPPSFTKRDDNPFGACRVGFGSGLPEPLPTKPQYATASQFRPFLSSQPPRPEFTTVTTVPDVRPDRDAEEWMRHAAELERKLQDSQRAQELNDELLVKTGNKNRQLEQQMAVLQRQLASRHAEITLRAEHMYGLSSGISESSDTASMQTSSDGTRSMGTGTGTGTGTGDEEPDIYLEEKGYEVQVPNSRVVLGAKKTVLEIVDVLEKSKPPRHAGVEMDKAATGHLEEADECIVGLPAFLGHLEEADECFV